VSLWETRDRIGKTDAIKLYLYKSLKRKLVRELERRKMKEANAEEVRVNLNLTTVEPHEVDIIETQKIEDIKRHLQRAVSGLTERQQEALFLKFYEGFSHEQIASIMELNSQSVYNLIYQALKTLRQSYKIMASIPLFPLLGLQLV
jgi:RNA polymerase sigma factor (sigma-70 family)